MSSITKLKGRVACETHDCYPAARSRSTGRVTMVKWIPKGATNQPATATRNRTVEEVCV